MIGHALFVHVVVLALLAGETMDQNVLRSQTDPTFEVERFEGIPSVDAIAQTPDGWLWFGGPDGLFRSDGVNIEPVGGPWGIDPIREILVGPDGSIHVVSGRSVLLGDKIAWHEGIDRLWHATNDRQQGLVWQMMMDDVWGAALARDGTLAVARRDGLWIRTTGNNDFRLRWPGSTDAAHSMAFDHAGTLWLGAPWGLAKLYRGEKQLHVEFGNPVHSIVAFGSETFVGRANEVIRVGFGRWLVPNTSTLVLAADANAVWAASSAGLEKLNFDGGTHKVSPLNGKIVRRMISDRDGTLWIGTQGGGLFRLRTHPAVVLPLPTHDAVPFSVLETRTHDLWVSSTVGLHRFTPDGRRHDLSLAKLGAWSPRGLAELADGIVVMASEVDGVVAIRRDIPSLHEVTRGSLHIRTSLVFVTSQGALLLGLDDGTVRRILHPDVDSPGFPQIHDGEFGVQQGLCPGRPVAATEESNGSIWLAHTGGGVSHLRHDGMRCFDEKAGLPSRYPVTLLADPAGGVWIGFSDPVGLAHIENDQVELISDREDPMAVRIHGIALDRKNRLWLTSNRGLFIMRRTDLDSGRAGGRWRLPLARFGLDDGLPSEECMTRFGSSIARFGDAWIAIPTIAGLALFPSDLAPQRKPVTTIVVGVSVRGHKVDGRLFSTTAPPLQLSEDDAPVEVTFSAPTSVRPKSLGFEYARDSSQAWTRIEGGRTLHLASLKVGSSQFHVRAVDEFGNPIGSNGRLALHVKPLWWRSLQTRIVAVAFFVVLVGFVVRVRQKIIRKASDAIAYERQRLARELHDGLAQGFTAITMHLSAARSRARRLAPDVLPLLEQTQQIVTRCTDVARDAIWNLRTLSRNMSLAEAVRAAIGRVNKGATGSVEIHFQSNNGVDSVPAEILYEVPLIAQEAVVNAVKHAQCSTVDVVLICNGERIALDVKDDGVGFKLAAGGAPTEQPGFGIVGMKERAARIFGKFSLTSEPGRGTHVSLTVELPSRLDRQRSRPATD